MATNLTAGLSAEHRILLLSELLETVTPEEKNLILTRFVPGAIEDVQAAQDATNLMIEAAERSGQGGQDMAKIAREIAERRNRGTGATAGVTGRKLI